MFLTTRCTLLLFLLAPVSLQAGPAEVVEEPAAAIPGGHDWTQFLGPNRTGLSAMTGLRRSWPAEGPREVWRRPLGEGFSGISVVGELLCTLFAVGSDELAGCFRVADGSETWRVRIGDKYVEEWGNGPRATPIIDGRSVYALSTQGNLFALDLESGEILWQLNLAERLGRTQRVVMIGHFVPEGEEESSSEFGHASSPLVVGDSLIVYAGAGNGKSVIALDKGTGETRWTALDSAGGNTSPSLVTIGGRQQVLVVVPDQVVALSLSGDVLWSHPWAMANAAQPAFVPPDGIFISTIFDVGAKLLTVTSSSDSQFGVDTAWENRLMRNHWASSVLYDGQIYGFDRATLKCLDAATGEMRWRQRGLGRGSVLIADGLLILLSDRGMLALAEASPTGYKETGRVQILAGQTLTAPTPARGKLFLRNHEEMVCLDLEP